MVYFEGCQLAARALQLPAPSDTSGPACDLLAMCELKRLTTKFFHVAQRGNCCGSVPPHQRIDELLFGGGQVVTARLVFRLPTSPIFEFETVRKEVVSRLTVFQKRS